MPENRSRFVLLCQQSLAFALVVAIAAPAANMVTLDIVAPARPRDPGSRRRRPPRSRTAAPPERSAGETAPRWSPPAR